MNTTEVEVRSFITKEQFDLFLAKFAAEGEFVREDHETNVYLTGPEDLRIMEGDQGAKVWAKTGKVHDDFREEVEVPLQKSDFANMRKFLKLAGHDTKIIWKRDRKVFMWNEITVCMDYTYHYGHIIELEKMTTPEEAERTFAELTATLTSLGVAITTREEFEQAFANYQTHWRDWFQE